MSSKPPRFGPDSRDEFLFQEDLKGLRKLMAGETPADRFSKEFKEAKDIAQQQEDERKADLMEEFKEEAVDHPSHYNAGEFEVIDVIADAGFGEGFCLGNALKYILRAKHKVDYTEDLQKAEWYLHWWNEYIKTHER